METPMSIPLAPERESLSSFMDGEIEPEHVDALVKACCQGGELREDWTVYHCIGDVLRSGDMGGHSSRLAEAVSARLAEEPFIVAMPRRPARYASMRRMASMAAAVAGVAVVAFVALPHWSGSGEKLTQKPVAGSQQADATPSGAGARPSPGPVAAPVVSSEFLAAHRQYSGGIAMQGMVGQVRNVALESSR